MLFCYSTYRKEIEKLLAQIDKTNKGYGNLKKTLATCCKHNYLSAKLDQIKGNTTTGRKQLITIAEAFISLKLVTTKTIKTRGWTDKMIAEHLWVDIYAKNPYYKTSGEMKLYCLSRVQNLECFNPEIKKAIAINLSRREKRDRKNQQRIISAPFKWLEAIGDPYIAIALLLRLLNKAVKTGCNYNEKRSFYKLKDKTLIKLQQYKTTTYIARKEYSKLLYCHWFDVNGFKFSLHSYQDLGYEGSQSLEQYNLKFGSELNDEDKKLLFKLSGWRRINEAIEGLSYLCGVDLIGSHKPTDNISLFSPSKHQEPPTEDYLFAVKLEQESIAMFNQFKSIAIHVLAYLDNGCPANYVCSKMGAINQYRCANYKDCKAIADQLS